MAGAMVSKPKRFDDMNSGTTHIGYTAKITRLECIDRSRKVSPRKVFHIDSRVVWPPGRATALDLRLAVALVDVRLCDEDRERGVVYPHVCPRDVACNALATFPRLEARGIDTVDHRDVVKMDVRDVGKRCLVLSERTDRHAVGLVADGTALEGDIVATALNCNSIVTVVYDRVCDLDVGCRYVEAISVEGEPATRGVGVDDRVRDGDVVTSYLHVPRDWLPRLEVSHAAIGGIEKHQVRPTSDTGAVDGIGVPPALAIRIDPASRNVRGAFEGDARTLKDEPVEIRRARCCGRRVEEFLHLCDILW